LLKGIVDRVDGWERDGKLYLRVIDYKTGRKSFDISDVVYGRDMQMLIYLFALQKYGAARYGRDVAPAGVLYVPARDVILKAQRNATDEDIEKSREKELRRGGLVLRDPLVLDAMEAGEEKKYLPVKLTKEGAISGDSLVTTKQIEVLSEHVDRMLRGAAGEILEGGIECRPYYKSDKDNACLYCEYRSVCGFDEESGDRRRFIRKLKPAEAWGQLTVDS
jgi:ATP-dependent helicase/nuclease subunit B